MLDTAYDTAPRWYRNPLRWLKDRTSYYWWRVVTFFALIFSVLALVFLPILYNRINDAVESNHEAITTNRQVLCALGDLVQLSNAPRAAALSGSLNHLRAELNFLTGIRDSHCPLIGAAAMAEINGTIRLIQNRLNQIAGD